MARTVLEEFKKVDINAKSAKGRTALHVVANKRASSKNNSSLSSRGLEDGGDAATTPEQSSVHARFAAFLYEHKVDRNLQDNSGATALHLACRSNNLAVAKYLLTANCDPTIVDNAGANPLHAAGARCWVAFRSGSIWRKCWFTNVSFVAQRLEVSSSWLLSSCVGMPVVASGVTLSITTAANPRMLPKTTIPDER